MQHQPAGSGSGAPTAARPIATFDITGACPLRCRHCYYYAAPPDAVDLGDAEFLNGARALRDQYAIRSAFWIGGEPLLRLPLLREAMRIFPRNALSTSGMLPIPDDLGAGMLVSIDGPESIHDALRGRGSFEQIRKNVRAVPGKFAISLTLTSRSIDAVENIPSLVDDTRAVGALIGFHVGPQGDPLRVDGPDRDRAVDRLLACKRLHPAAILNSESSLELFRPHHQEHVREHCIYVARAIAFDNRLQPKLPCTFGPRAACDSCGCPVVMTQWARDNGDTTSDALLRVLFPEG